MEKVSIQATTREGIGVKGTLSQIRRVLFKQYVNIIA